MKCLSFAKLVAVSALLAACVSAPNPNAVPTAASGVYFVSPHDGATVTSPFKVEFGVKGMAIKPAGAQVPGSGHHHLLVNRESIASGQSIPADDVHLHFGKGQSETEVKLPPGSYMLTLQLGDGLHLSYGKDMSSSIHVTVK